MDQARNLIPLFPTDRIGIQKDIRGLLEKNGPTPRFRVRFAARSQFSALLSHTRRDTNLNLELRDDRGRLVAASRRLANRPDHIQIAQLAPGTYFVQPVLARGKWSRFRLRVQTTPIPDVGNLPSTARTLEVSSTPFSLDEFIGAEDRDDYYRFTVGSNGSPTGQVRLGLAGLNGDLLNGNVTVTIRNSNLNVVQRRTTAGRIGFNLDETLPAGTYFVQVQPAQPDRDQTHYRLSLAATSIADAAGNTPNAGREVSLSSTPTLLQDFVGVGDLQDYYRFTVPKSQFNLRLTGLNGNLLNGEITVRLRNDVNTIIDQVNTNGGAGVAIENRNLAPGSYVVQVSTSAKSVPYSLSLVAEPRA
ncbi:MAG: hypothetical protein MUF72_13215 [Elainella sp. Prado103]|jgi:hypothetical protein|nr:hypothetical protein [Elainella sp. Prado103]